MSTTLILAIVSFLLHSLAGYVFSTWGETILERILLYLFWPAAAVIKFAFDVYDFFKRK